MNWVYVYILRCADDSYYVGLTEDPNHRLAQHQVGLGCLYTAKRLPVVMVWCEHCGDRLQAARLEKQIKGWNRAKKEALIEGRFEDLPELAKKTDWSGWVQRRLHEESGSG